MYPRARHEEISLEIFYLLPASLQTVRRRFASSKIDQTKTHTLFSPSALPWTEPCKKPTLLSHRFPDSS